MSTSHPLFAQTSSSTSFTVARPPPPPLSVDSSSTTSSHHLTDSPTSKDPSQPFDLGTAQAQPSNSFDFGSLGPFSFSFASHPLPSISSFGAFPDFRHHPLVLPQEDPSGSGGGLIEKPAELASSIPTFNFGAKRTVSSLPPRLSPDESVRLPRRFPRRIN